MKNKKGISLIVLVITIVVMIILATVVILSLDSSNIIERANEAKEATNLANLKEAASVALAEYKLEVSLGNIDEKAVSANDYVKNKLEEQGMDTSRMAVSKEGKVMTGLSKVAAKFVGEGVEKGATVTGYTLRTDSSAKTVSTDGTENTCDAFNISETNPQPATGIKRDENISWSYMGLDKNGNVLIVGSVTSNTPKLTLGGKGGFLNGVNVLNEICDTMYSTDMGKARNISIEDIVNVLEYKGEQGSYYNASAAYTTTQNIMTIGNIETKLGLSLLNRVNVDGTNIENYDSDYYYIDKANDIGEYNSKFQNLVYPSTSITNLTTTYWISSECVVPHFEQAWSQVCFLVRYCNNSKVDGCEMFNSNSGSLNGQYAIRPVVELTSDVNVTVNANGSVTLSK